MLFNTSQDLLYVILAICVVWFTFFLCWLLYQAARVLRNANRIIETVTHKLELINEAVQFMKEKVDGVSKNMGMVSSMMTGLVEKFVVGKLVSKLEDKIKGTARMPVAKKKMKAEAMKKK